MASAPVPQHFEVYREAGRYGGWPANYGIWSWPDGEIVVGFTVGYFDPRVHGHKRDKTRPFATMQARSLDGGEAWQVRETPCRSPGGRALSADEHQAPALQVGAELTAANNWKVSSGGIDFTHPDFALMCARSDLRQGAISWFYISIDRCHSWDGPYRLPSFGQPGMAARTDYVVSGPERCALFLTAAKSNGDEGRVFCARTEDGGRSFSFVSWIGPEPAGYAIMPSSVHLSGTSMLTAVRRRGGRAINKDRCWIDLYRSDDDGASWHLVGRPVSHTGRGGNPPSMIRLLDGRLCLTYGYRDPPFGIRAKLSRDEGQTWGKEIALRADGGDWDIGYPRTAQRSDGKIVTVYYFDDDANAERYIAATVWEPA